MSDETGSKTKHTPGPWVFEGGRYGNDKVEVVAKRSGASRLIAAVHAFESRKDKDAEALTEEGEANANLIAAAPDLLEEHHRSLAAFIDLDSCLDRAGYKVTSLERCLAQDGIRATKAAIAKAEGRS